MVKQLGIHTYFLTLPFLDLIWEGLPSIINKLNKFGLCEGEVENLSYKNRCNLLDNNLVLVASACHYKVKIFSKDMILDCLLGKTKCYAVRIEFQERVVHMSILLCGFSMHQIFKLKQPTSVLLKKQK